MVSIIKSTKPVSAHKFKGKRRGSKSKLSNYDKVLMMLMYYREYRTYAHIGSTYNISETLVLAYSYRHCSKAFKEYVISFAWQKEVIE